MGLKEGTSGDVNGSEPAFSDGSCVGTALCFGLSWNDACWLADCWLTVGSSAPSTQRDVMGAG